MKVKAPLLLLMSTIPHHPALSQKIKIEIENLEAYFIMLLVSSRLIGTRLKVRSWIQDPPGACLTYQSKKKLSY